jgi:antitoxin YefM
MKTLSSTQLRANLSAVMDQVNDDHEPVIVTRAKGKPVVIVSLEDWASMDETTYLLSSPRNAERLREAVRGLKAGEGVPRDLVEE